MDREEAIQRLQEFKEESGLGRDTLIDVYNHFRVSSDIGATGVVYKGELVKVSHDEFWDYINTSDIREICKSGVTKTNVNEEFDSMVTKLRKEKLNANDKLNFERRITNKSLRTINTIEEFEQEIIKGLDKLKPIKYNETSVIDLCNSDDVLLVQLSDLHINEITNEFREVGYDINIASKRLKKFANKIKNEIVSKGIKKVVIASTGDMVGSDLIEPKKANCSCNKATATIMCIVLLQHFILDIYEVCDNITVFGTAGNEDRWSKEYFTEDNLITNSADFIVLNALELLFKDILGINFLQGKYNERIVEINNQNILFTHGTLYTKGDVTKAFQQTVARYSDKNINVRFAVFGHLHETFISNFFMRSSSLVGNNSYASNTLNLNSRASQNIAFISKDGDIIAQAIDLHNVDNIYGYDIEDEIRKFNLKPASRTCSSDIIERI